MDLLRFFKQVKYIKELENTIEDVHPTMMAQEKVLEKYKQLLNEEQSKSGSLIIRNSQLQKEIAQLKSSPPELKYASNIDISDPIFQKMIKAGRNAIVKKAHPDHGGSREDFEKVEKAFEMLKGLKIQPQKKPLYHYSGLGPNTDRAEQARRQYEGLRAQQPYNQWPYNY